MKTYTQRERDIINPDTEMHYAILSSFNGTKYPHKHDFYEFFLLIEGVQTLDINQYSLTLNPGALVLVRPGDIHSRRYIESGLHINIAFSSSIARSMFEYLGNGYPADELLKSDLPPYITLNRTESDRIQRRMREVYAVSLTAPNLQRTKLRILILDIFVNYFSKTISHDTSHDSWFEHLLREMEKPEYLAEGLPALLRISHKSHEYLCRVFRQYLNCTPTQYVNELKLNYAANFLLHSDIPVIDVCMNAGFDNLSHFYHLFKKKYGMAPRQFRASQVHEVND